MQIKEIQDGNLKKLTKFFPQGWKLEIQKRANVSNHTLNKYLNGGDIRYSKGKAIRREMSIFYHEIKTDETALLQQIMSE